MMHGERIAVAGRTSCWHGFALLLHLALLLPQPSFSRRGRKATPEFGVKMDEFGVDLSTNGRDEASAEMKSKLPNRKDPEVARQLKCSICVALVHELHKALPKYKGKRRPKEYEVAEAIDDICLEFERYGLQMEHNTPTVRYADDQKVAMHKGGWVERHAIHYCGEVLEDEEDMLVAAVHNALGEPNSHEAAVVAFCQNGFPSGLDLCRAEERDLLGDWDGDGKTGRLLGSDGRPLNGTAYQKRQGIDIHVDKDLR
eukprot:SAG11_NODE_6_length_32111_cov_33.703174_9_plen_256_part_00